MTPIMEKNTDRKLTSIDLAVKTAISLKPNGISTADNAMYAEITMGKILR